jgi:hypothetical protein
LQAGFIENIGEIIGIRRNPAASLVKPLHFRPANE